MKNKFEWFLEKFYDCSERDQIKMNNRYCDENSHTDDIIYYMSELDTVFNGYTPTQFFELFNKSKLDILDKYFVCSNNRLISFYSVAEQVCIHLDGIFENDDIWKNYIDIDEYKDEMFNELSELKPTNMNDENFYYIVSDAIDKNVNVNDIKECVKNDIERKQEQH